MHKRCAGRPRGPRSDTVEVVLHPSPSDTNDIDALVEALGLVEGITVYRPASPEDVEAVLAGGAEVLVTYEWNDSYLQPGLRWVQGQGVGAEQYPHDLLRERGIVLTNARGVQSSVMAEHVFGLLLGLTRGIAASVRRSAGRQWYPCIDYEISAMTMGIVGLGSVGEAIAQRAEGWGVDLIGVVRHPQTYNGRVARVCGMEHLLDVCTRSDILVICLPGGEETHHVIGSRELRALGEGWLVNIGRGTVLDEHALIDELQHGRLRGAGLDVFEREPLPLDSPLWSMPQVIITPHKAGATPRYAERFAELFGQNLRALKGTAQWVNRLV